MLIRLLKIIPSDLDGRYHDSNKRDELELESKFDHLRKVRNPS